MIHVSEIKITVTYGSDFQEKTWEKMVEASLTAVRDMMEKAHTCNTMSWDTFTKS